ncbi:multidrug resistance protein NorM [Andreesenia angusta]|uniref:Probable multidrug resistance protein NorM n=1 Tax=Andreesenia angusta TaxID=39480 RepID=A0A1S1V6H0_9FIRM|nr:MATE family efflux transporter [Andreesenia angusta]OHW62104.1 multidrug resistance protein NorM [Andreesenia angusta]
MKGKNNLTEGNIVSTLLKLSVPIIATNFIQTAYGMVDMIWIGRLGSKSVAAIGTASFFVNLAMALFTIVIIGSGVKIAHSIGAGDSEGAEEYIKSGFIMSFILAIVYALFILIFRDRLIGFFELGDPEVERLAVQYLVISMVGVLFMCFNNLYSNIFNSYGNSAIPFRVNSIGLLLNIVLDPILIFGIGFIPPMGVAGAAIATVFCRLLVLMVFYTSGKRYFKVFGQDIKFNREKAKSVIKMGIPITTQRVTFIFISIMIAKIIAVWGPTAIAVQKVGLQIESISYMTIGGLQGAIAAFIGQNYGAKKFKRIREGYYKSLAMTLAFGATVTAVFLIFPEQIFKIFLNDKESLEIGVYYMRILGISQAFMCMELLTVGAFNGLGKTYVAPIISITFTALRIPIALLLSSEDLFKLNGIWMSISVSSIVKGLLLVSMFLYYLRRNKEKYLLDLK